MRYEKEQTGHLENVPEDFNRLFHLIPFLHTQIVQQNLWYSTPLVAQVVVTAGGIFHVSSPPTWSNRRVPCKHKALRSYEDRIFIVGTRSLLERCVFWRDWPLRGLSSWSNIWIQLTVCSLEGKNSLACSQDNCFCIFILHLPYSVSSFLSYSLFILFHFFTFTRLSTGCAVHAGPWYPLGLISRRLCP
jgi:hypothetical protein